jgi:prevent-host-death family protein
MQVVNIHEAKTRLSQLVVEVERGGEVIVSRRGRPVARLVPYEAERPVRVFGAMKGKAKVDARFFEPLPEDELAAWE